MGQLQLTALTPEAAAARFSSLMIVLSLFCLCARACALAVEKERAESLKLWKALKDWYVQQVDEEQLESRGKIAAIKYNRIVKNVNQKRELVSPLELIPAFCVVSVRFPAYHCLLTFLWLRALAGAKALPEIRAAGERVQRAPHQLLPAGTLLLIGSPWVNVVVCFVDVDDCVLQELPAIIDQMQAIETQRLDEMDTRLCEHLLLLLSLPVTNVLCVACVRSEICVAVRVDGHAAGSQVQGTDLSVRCCSMLMLIGCLLHRRWRRA